MKPLIVRYSRWYFIFQPLIFLALASGPFVILHDVKQPKSWDLFGIIIFGGMAVLAGWGLVFVFLRKPLMILNDEGFFAESLAVGIIPWSDIEQAFIHGRGSWKNSVELLLRNPEVYLNRQSWLRRAFTSFESALGKPVFTLSLKLADTSARTLVAYISQRLNQQLISPNTQ